MNGRQSGDGSTRERLAITMVAVAVGGIVVIAALAIWLANDRSTTTQQIFNSLLPLFGTWVGTVLAFYFAKDNLQAATQSTLALRGGADAQTSVLQAMLPKSRITSCDLAAGVKADAVPLFQLLASMQKATVQRIPILNSTGGVEYVVHDSTIRAYADSVKKDPTDPNVFVDTVGDLKVKVPYGTAIQAIGVVGPNAVLADARAAMRAVDGCNDVFVTSTGQRSDPMMGWLTNTDLASIS